MKQYFFDVAVHHHFQRDYRGRAFEKPEKAREWAELIALDLGCSYESQWVGGEVRVHNVTGERLFSVSIRQLDLIAA